MEANVFGELLSVILILRALADCLLCTHAQHDHTNMCIRIDTMYTVRIRGWLLGVWVWVVD